MSINLEQDLRTRWAPSTTQVQTAIELLAPYAHLQLSVIVPIALNYKDFGIWDDGVDVQPIEGVYVLADRAGDAAAAMPWSEARELVMTIAEQNSIEGTGSYAIIDDDGFWSVHEL